MTAAFLNATLFLVKTLFNLALGLFLVRVLLQAVRADFYNPISQLVWRSTQAVATPLQRLLPRVRGRFDIACMVVAFGIAWLYIEAIANLLHLTDGPFEGAFFALCKILSLLITMYTMSLFIQAVLSWIGPGVSNSAANILWSLNEPLLRPVRRWIPPISGLDLTPLVVMLVLQLLYRFVPLPAIYV